MSTIRDVAKHANVSVATVSKYLNGGHVREQKELAIQAAMQELEYQINPYAKSLRTRRSMAAGILLPSALTPFFSNMLQSLDASLRRAGYQTLVSFYRPDHGIEREKLQFLSRAGIDALAYTPENITAGEFQDIFSAGSMPVVLIDRMIAGIQTADAVLVDSAAAVQAAVGRLIDRQHRRIAIINGPPSVFTAKERMAGYLHALSEHAIAYDPDYVQSGEYAMRTGYQGFLKLMSLPQPPTAIITMNYDLTLGALTAAQERSVRIPEEIALFGFDCSDICNVIASPIPIIQQPEQALGSQTAQFLLERMNGYTGPARLAKLHAAIINE